MADKQEPPKQPFNFFNLFSTFKPPQKPVDHEATTTSDNTTQNKPAAAVRFPRAQPAVAPTVASEVEEPITKTSNPIVVWQVYALGGFLVLKWIWGRWQERNHGKNEDDVKDEEEDSDNDEE